MQAGFQNGDTRLWSRFNALLSFAVINVHFSGFLWAKILIIGLPIVVSTKRFHPYNCLENVSFAQTRRMACAQQLSWVFKFQ